MERERQSVAYLLSRSMTATVMDAAVACVECVKPNNLLCGIDVYVDVVVDRKEPLVVRP